MAAVRERDGCTTTALKKYLQIIYISTDLIMERLTFGCERRGQQHDFFASGWERGTVLLAGSEGGACKT